LNTTPAANLAFSFNF